MTHDELLEMIDKQEFTIVYEDHKSEFEILRLFGFRKALRAVVELHKPSFAVVDGVKGLEWCYQCADQRGYAKYPCPTIQAIEKELK